MKHLCHVVVLAVLFSAISLGQVKWSIGGQISPTFTSAKKPLNEVYGFGFGFGAHVRADISKQFAGKFSIDYTMVNSDKEKFKSVIGGGTIQDPNTGEIFQITSVEGANIKLLSFTLSGLARIPTSGVLTPYGILGLGLYSFSTSDLKFTVQGNQGRTGTGEQKIESETKFGMNFGAGVEFKAAKNIVVFAEPKYVIVFTSGESTSFIPITLGASFGL